MYSDGLAKGHGPFRRENSFERRGKKYTFSIMVEWLNLTEQGNNEKESNGQKMAVWFFLWIKRI